MIDEHSKHVLDGAAALGAAGALFDALPKLAAACAIVWYAWRFWDAWGRAALARLRKRTGV